MSWETISLSEIPLDEKPQPVPAGRYTLQVLSAEEGKFRAGSINLTLAITDEGSYAGRRIFVDLPNVDEQPWVAKVVAQMAHAMGATFAPYTNPIEEFNRVATNGHSRFMGDVTIETFKRSDGSQGTKNKLNYRSIAPSA